MLFNMNISMPEPSIIDLDIPMSEPSNTFIFEGCRFCHYIYTHSIKEHESKCLFNKLNKSCYTCKFHFYNERLGYRTSCSKGLDCDTIKEFGGCGGWISETLQMDREENINKILE